ncbi:MAG: hypothetical protein QM497_06250 [Sulfurimonas sp.]
MFDLKAKLEKEFIDVEIVKLEDLAKKIAVISKVRVGKERSVLDYHEVTLADVNEYGIITVDSTKEKPAPANSSAIASQVLHKNDLLVSYRGVDIKVGRIDKEYKKPIVSNNSAIRIQFDYEDKDEEEEISMFVQAYLQLPYVKEYIAKRPQSSENNRKILSPLFLSKLPIPLFHSRNYDFKELVNNRLKAVNIAKELLKEMQELKEKLENHKNDSLSLYLNSSKLNPEVKDQDMRVLKSLYVAKEKIEKQLKDL